LKKREFTPLGVRRVRPPRGSLSSQQPVQGVFMTTQHSSVRSFAGRPTVFIFDVNETLIDFESTRRANAR
jgi:hypothetical protein